MLVVTIHRDLDRGDRSKLVLKVPSSDTELLADAVQQVAAGDRPFLSLSDADGVAHHVAARDIHHLEIKEV